MAEPTDERSIRSYALLTREHLKRLRDISEQHHRVFAERFPEWAAVRLASCLVQGGARHYLHHDRGVKDLDVYLFYALPPGRKANEFPWNRYDRVVDFGPSALGRNLYTDDERSLPKIAGQLRELECFDGRRVDLMARAIGGHPNGARAAVRAWLERGAKKRRSRLDAKMDSDWHLARCPVVCLWPELEAVWWNGPADDEAGREKGAYS